MSGDKHFNDASICLEFVILPSPKMLASPLHSTVRVPRYTRSWNYF